MPYQFSERLVERVALAQSCFAGAEAVLGSEKVGERAVDLISDDFFVGHEDVLEDRLIELAPYFITRAWPSWQNGTHLVDPRLYAKLVNNRDHSAELSINWANEEAANSRDRPLAEYPGWIA